MADQSTRSDHSGATRSVDDNRSWMYRERKGKLFSPAWQHGLDSFLEYAFSLPDSAVDGESHCPCTKCFCHHKRKRDDMTRHLCNNGFMLGYERWTSHGESDTPETIEHDNDGDRMEDMLTDAIAAEGVSAGDEPTEVAKKFYEMLVEADKPLHEKTTQSRLSIVGRLMTTKTQHNMSEACYNEIMNLIHDIVGDDAAKDLPTNFHRSKKLVHSFAMPYVKIHACPNNCMIYYKETENKDKCTICKEPRYEETTTKSNSRKIPRKVLRYLPITPRLQRLYMSQSTAEHMSYHARPRDSDKVMVHPSDGEAWKKFNIEYKEFAEAREVRLERENEHLRRESKRLRGIELVLRSLAEKGGVDYDAMIQSDDLATSDSEVGCGTRRDADPQRESEKGMGSNGSPSREKNHDTDDDEDDIYDNRGDDGYDYGDDYNYGYNHGDEHYDEDNDDYGDDGEDY